MASFLDIVANPLIAKKIREGFDLKTAALVASVGRSDDAVRENFDLEAAILERKKLSYKEVRAMANGDRLPCPDELRNLQVLDLSDYSLVIPSTARSFAPQVAEARGTAPADQPDAEGAPTVPAPRVRRQEGLSAALAQLAADDNDRNDEAGGTASNGSAGCSPHPLRSLSPPKIAAPAAPPTAASAPEFFSRSVESPLSTPLRPPSTPVHQDNDAAIAASRMQRSLRSVYSTARRRGRAQQEQHENIAGGAGSTAQGPCRWVEDASRCEAFCLRLKKLRVSNNLLLPMRVLEALLSNVTAKGGSLELLDLGNMDRVDDVVLTKIQLHTKLKAVQLSNCFRITDAGLTHVAKACPSLEKLLLAGCPRVTDAGLKALMEEGCCGRKSLRTLAITPRMGGITADKGVAETVFGPFVKSQKNGKVDDNPAAVLKRNQWLLRQLLLHEPRFEDEAKGWRAILDALWAYQSSEKRDAQDSEEPFVLRLASPFGLSDAIVEAFVADKLKEREEREEKEESLLPQPSTSVVLKQRSVRLELAGKHDVSPAALALLESIFTV